MKCGDCEVKCGAAPTSISQHLRVGKLAPSKLVRSDVPVAVKQVYYRQLLGTVHHALGICREIHFSQTDSRLIVNVVGNKVIS